MRKTISLSKCIRISVLLLGVGLFIQSLHSCTNEAPQEEAVTVSAPTGEALFVSYCQICHGTHGDGPMAEMLKVAPPDLTLISARRDGNFPVEQITKIVDGRDRLEGHGKLDMPIWGATFMESEALQNEEQLKERIDLLVSYLESIQRPAEPETEG